MTTTRHFHIDWYVIVFSISLEEYIVQYRFDLWSHIYKKLDRLLDTQKVAGRGYRHTDIQAQHYHLRLHKSIERTTLRFRIVSYMIYNFVNFYILSRKIVLEDKSRNLFYYHNIASKTLRSVWSINRIEEYIHFMTFKIHKANLENV